MIKQLYLSSENYVAAVLSVYLFTCLLFLFSNIEPNFTNKILFPTFAFKFDDYLTVEIIHMKKNYRKWRNWWLRSEGDWNACLKASCGSQKENNHQLVWTFYILFFITLLWCRNLNSKYSVRFGNPFCYLMILKILPKIEGTQTPNVMCYLWSGKKWGIPIPKKVAFSGNLVNGQHSKCCHEPLQ